MNSSQSFLKHAAVYGLASMLTQAAGFVLLPLYTRYLSPADYGVLEILGRIAETAATVLLFGGFRQALFTFYQQASDEKERRRVVSAAFLLAASRVSRRHCPNAAARASAALALPYSGEPS